MAEFIIETLSPSKYFKFDDARETATQCSMAEATGFASEELARIALKEAASKLAAKTKNGAPSAKWAQLALQLPLADMGQSFTVSARPTLTDLVGVFDAYYARSSSGWLSRPHLRSHDGRLWWSESFAFAAPFPDAKSALRAMASNSYSANKDTFSVVKASCVFTEVSAPAAAGPDEVRSAIQSACEARDISSELQASAKERIEAMSPSAPEAAPAPKRSRL